MRTFALPKSGGGGTNPLEPPTFESGGGAARAPPCPPFSYALGFYYIAIVFYKETLP